MSDEQSGESKSEKWRTLPPHTALEDTVASQEVPPKPQAIAEPGNEKLDEATRYPI